jgi:hypothetical protein
VCEFPKAHALANGGGSSEVIRQDAATGFWAMLCPGCKLDGNFLTRPQHFKLAGAEAYTRIKNWGLERSVLEAGGAVCPLAGCNKLIDRTQMPGAGAGAQKATCPHCDGCFDRELNCEPAVSILESVHID